MVLPHGLGIFARLRHAAVTVVGIGLLLSQIAAISLAMQVALGLLQAGLQFDPLGVAEAVHPLQIAAQHLPTSMDLTVVFKAGLTGQDLVLVMDPVIPVAALHESLQGQRFGIADLPVQPRAGVDAMTPDRLFGLLDRARSLAVKARHIALVGELVQAAPLESRERQRH